jgi:hypothetical protein
MPGFEIFADAWSGGYLARLVGEVSSGVLAQQGCKRDQPKYLLWLKTQVPFLVKDLINGLAIL